jgi:hypothetical protein
MHFRVLLRIADEEVAIDVLDAERRKAGRDVRIFEATGCCRLDILAIAGVVGGLEDVDCSSMEVSRK